ncbi:MAG: hypothetical protein M0R76_06010 [Proteobacteria bacterium]|nr:hypothetical protein [Pseudomonadota bacterium]
MIRFVLNQIRQAPGPLKGTRSLLVDLAEEVIDLTWELLRPPPPSPTPTSAPPEATADPLETPVAASPPPTSPPVDDTARAAATPAPQPAAAPKPKVASPPAKPSKTTKTSLPLPSSDDEKKIIKSASKKCDPRLKEAMGRNGNIRKQAFKVLAILWDADQKNLGPLSAKALSLHGENIKLPIRHENVRKVIRMRLERYVHIHPQEMGNGTVYRYNLSKEGHAHFETTYLGRESE